MTAKKNLRKIWWFDEWQVEEIESWLGDMAARGWHFSRRGLLTAVFTRGEPEQVRYRCEIAKKSSPDFQDRVEFIAREAGNMLPVMDTFRYSGPLGTAPFRKSTPILRSKPGLCA
ncbi:MAG: DUF2812 domain-containing protein, partial [Eubacteriales bacterium]|nr:DUF2812 domain-containing protein [Eubacteriales bacterium]